MEIFYKVLSWVLKIQSARAGGAPGSIELTSPTGNQTILDLLKRIATYAYWIAFPIAVIMILYGAFQILTAAGDPNKVSSGRKTIIYTLVGLVIVIVAAGLPSLIQQILGVS